jgi:CheY-like chemotaxis protein
MAKKVLFVDNDMNTLKFFEMMAHSLGYSPRCALDGATALQIMEQDQIRVFFLDLRMPQMDGVELCRQIKQRTPGACVYAVSGYSSAFGQEQLRAIGFDAYFTKPFEFNMLKDALDKAFSQ